MSVKHNKKESKGKLGKGKKKTTKNRVKKTKQDSENIKKAVKDLPSVLMQEIHQKARFEEQKRQDAQELVIKVESVTPKKKTVQIYSSPKHSKAWLWSAVFIFTIVIFFLWIMSLSNLFFDNKNGSNGPLDSLKDTKGELQNIFKNFDDRDNKSEDLQNFITSSTLEDNVTSMNNIQKVQEVMNGLFVSTTASTTNFTTTTDKLNN